MIVYIDVLFLENFIIDFILLYCVDFFLKGNTKWRRIFFGASIGSFFSIIFTMISLNIFIGIIVKFLLGIIIVWASFGRKNNFLRRIIIFYLISFVFGGVCFAFCDYRGLLINKISVFNLCFYIFLGFCFCKCIAYFIKIKRRKNDLICDIDIGICDDIFRIKVLIDTGNLLREPCTGKGVIIVEKSFLNKAFGADFFDNVLKSENIKLYVIPYSSLGNDSGALVGIPCNFVKGVWEKDFFIDDVIVGIYNGKLSRFNEYFGIIGAECLL